MADRFYQQITDQLENLGRNVHHVAHLAEQVLLNQERLADEVQVLRDQVAAVQAEPPPDV